MKKALIALSFGVLLAQPVQAQQYVSKEQAEQLIATLKQRNDQVRDLSAQLRAMEAKVAAADQATRELEAARKAVQIAADKNRELRDLGNSIIADYEKMSLGGKAASKEPLTQLYRVILENKRQDCSDQVDAIGVYPSRDTAPAPAPGQ